MLCSPEDVDEAARDQGEATSAEMGSLYLLHIRKLPELELPLLSTNTFLI